MKVSLLISSALILSLSVQTTVLAMPWTETNEEYTVWLNSKGSQYKQHTFLETSSDPTDGMAVHWTIEDDMIRMAVAAEAKGWMGFGTIIDTRYKVPYKTHNVNRYRRIWRNEGF